MRIMDTVDWTQTPYVNEVIEGLKTKAKELYERDVKDHIWTEEMKSLLKDIGNKYGYVVWGTGLDNSEWLFDVCWIKDGDQWMTEFSGLEMACEMEWGESGEKHLEDFLKLTVCNANLRLFLFGCRKAKDCKGRFDLFRQRSSYTKGQKYIAIGIPRDKRVTPCDAWIT